MLSLYCNLSNILSITFGGTALFDLLLAPLLRVASMPRPGWQLWFPCCDLLRRPDSFPCRLRRWRIQSHIADGWILLRDILLITQIAICSVVVTSSLVAVRGLMRSRHSGFGFRPEGVMLAATDTHMGGYSDDRTAEMQQRLLNAVAAIPGVTKVR